MRERLVTFFSSGAWVLLGANAIVLGFATLFEFVPRARLTHSLRPLHRLFATTPDAACLHVPGKRERSGDVDAQ
jgi:hypothetical protein